MTGVITTEQFILSHQQNFSNALSTDLVNWNKESQFAIQYLQNNSYLEKVAMANPGSLKNAIINIAAIGVSLNPAEKRAYLVPRDNRVCLDISYMGLLHIATTEGSIEWGQAKIVYENDVYENQGLTKEPVHRYKAFGDRGNPIGCYCTVKLPTGDYMTEEMDKETIHGIRNRSKGFASGKNTPWKTDELEMWRKTVVKRASKYWPKPQQSRLDEAVNVLNQDSGEGLEKSVVCSEGQKKKLFDICELMGKEYSEVIKVINAKFKTDYKDIESVEHYHMSQFLEFASTMANYYNNYSGMLDAYENGDEQYIFECLEEITEQDQKYLWCAYTKFGFIKGDIQKELRAIHAKVKREQYELNQ